MWVDTRFKSTVNPHFDDVGNSGQPDDALQHLHHHRGKGGLLILDHKVHAHAITVAHDDLDRVVRDPEGPQCTRADRSDE